MARRHIAFGWYGGKYSHLDWLLPKLPNTQHYCEPFGGSAAVLLNRDPSPVETYNDVDSEVVNFFRVLREHPEELTRRIGLTPFSREEYAHAIDSNGSARPATKIESSMLNGERNGGYTATEPEAGQYAVVRVYDETDLHSGSVLSDIERARRFFVRARQSRTGLAQTASIGRWANCLNTSRAGMAGAVSRWLGSVPELEWVASRLLSVQIEHDDAIKVITRYDSPSTLFYCDPPYPHGSRGDSKAYGYEMTDEEHVQLFGVLSSVQGKVAVSGYHCELLDTHYRDWKIHEEGAKKAHSVKEDRSEVLWTNY